MKRAPTSPALVAASAELLLLRCTDGPVPLGEALGATAAWLAVGLVGWRLGGRTPPGAALPVALFAAALPLWRDGGPADASPLTWAGVVLLLAAAPWMARRGPVAWVAHLGASVVLTLLTTDAVLPPAGVRVALGLALGALAALGRTPLLALMAALLASQAPRALYDPRPVAWADVPPSDGPDLVLVVVDTLRGDAGRAMRSHARLAAGGRRFERATASGPWTLPSMASLLTAQPVGTHGAGARPDGPPTALAATVPTVAERLAAAGYDTAAVVAPNPWIGRAWGFHRGFAVWEHAAELHPSALPANPAVPGAHPLPVLALHSARGLLGRPAPLRADPLVDRAVEVLRARRDRPIFLWLHLLDPHLPWSGLPGVDVATLRTDPRWRSPEGRERARAAYLAEVQRVDGSIERLLDALGPAPPRGRVVILTSDHGEEFLEHGGFEHGHTLYQELLDVPLVVAGTGVVAGVEPQAVGLDQVGATLLAAAGLPASVDLRGPAPARPVLSGNLLSGHPGEGLAVRVGDDKRIHLPGTDHRYDLAADPEEHHPRPAPPLRSPPPVIGGAPDGAAARTLLEQLGYLDR